MDPMAFFVDSCWWFLKDLDCFGWQFVSGIIDHSVGEVSQRFLVVILTSNIGEYGSNLTVYMFPDGWQKTTNLP